jgi:hypothetical protein
MYEPQIKISFNELLAQSHATADSHLAHAIESVDKHFGAGYAKQWPNVVIAFMNAAASDFQTSAKLKVAESIAAELIAAFDEHGQSVVAAGEHIANALAKQVKKS